jgi:death-on-curing protein
LPTVDPLFLTDEDVLAIHADQFGDFGGAQGVRDLGLLSSAVAQPCATFGGVFLHAELYDMAAAYLYHLTKNHPFVDGNKRTAMIAALDFLDLNGVDVEMEAPDLFDLVVGVAAGHISKMDAANELRRLFPNPQRI